MSESIYQSLVYGVVVLRREREDESEEPLPWEHEDFDDDHEKWWKAIGREGPPPFDVERTGFSGRDHRKTVLYVPSSERPGYDSIPIYFMPEELVPSETVMTRHTLRDVARFEVFLGEFKILIDGPFGHPSWLAMVWVG